MSKKKHDDDYVDDNFENTTDDSVDDVSDDEWSDTQEEYIDDDIDADNIDNNKQEPVKKKKSQLSTIIIVAVVLLLAIGFFILSGGSSNNSTVPVDETAQEIDLQEPQPVTETNPVTTTNEVTSSTELNSVAPLPPVNTVAPVTETPVVQNENKPENLPVPMSEPMPAPVLETTSTANPSDFPTVDKILKPQPDVNATENVTKIETENNVVDKSVTPNTTDLSNNETSSAPIAEPTSTVQSDAYKEVADKLVKAEAKIAELEKNLTEIGSLKDKISDLESRLAEKSAAIEKPQNTIVENNIPEIKEVKVVLPKPIIKPVVKKQTSPVKWILKSVSNGKAIIATENGSDLKTVYVGDNVASIGVVTKIEKTASGWVIKGTKSNISQ